jgi:transcriptional regulator with XRE-family HTH domain
MEKDKKTRILDTYFGNFAERLTSLRKRANLSREEMANYLGMNSTAYGYYETGTRKPPLDKIILLSQYFNTSIDELLGYSPDEFEKCRNIVKPLFEVSGPNTPELIRTLYSVKDDTSGDKVHIAMKESKPGGTVSTFCPMLMDKKYFIDLVHKCATIPQEQILEKFRTAYMEEFFKHALENKPDKAQ